MCYLARSHDDLLKAFRLFDGEGKRKVDFNDLKRISQQIGESIDETCKNAGEIELVYRPEKRNNVRLALFMDVGGTMDPYYEPVSRLQQRRQQCEARGPHP